VAAIQKEVETLDPQEQDRLVAFLAILRHSRDPAHRAELTRRLNDQDPSQWISLSEVKERLGIA